LEINLKEKEKIIEYYYSKMEEENKRHEHKIKELNSQISSLRMTIDK